MAFHDNGSVKSGCSMAWWSLAQPPQWRPTPSQADIQMTKAIVDIATPLGISVHDHIIVGRGRHASLKGMRLI
jgi:DNA repair protein RadC